MAELPQDAAALLLPPPAGVALALLLEPSLEQPARPALAASMAIAAIAATVICLIPELLVLTREIKRIIIPNGRARAPRPGQPRRGEGRNMTRFLYLVRRTQPGPMCHRAVGGY
jgi:hypothetical protein